MTAAAPIEYVNRFRPNQAEIDRRYANTRKAMAEHGIDYLVVSGSEYSIYDLGTRRGTFLNGERVEKSPLRSGDSIQVGELIQQGTQTPIAWYPRTVDAVG